MKLKSDSGTINERKAVITATTTFSNDGDDEVKEGDKEYKETEDVTTVGGSLARLDPQWHSPTSPIWGDEDGGRANEWLC